MEEMHFVLFKFFHFQSSRAVRLGGMKGGKIIQRENVYKLL